MIHPFIEAIKEQNAFYLGEELAIEKLNHLDKMIQEKRKTFMGYPCNGDFKLHPFFDWWVHSSLSQSPMNEVGNPKGESYYHLNARPFEADVLQYFADLYSLKPHWGYITSGGTQGNEQGLYMGREILKQHGKPLFYFSEEAHYSLERLGKILQLESRMIKTKANGEMDYDDLKEKLDPNRPALFSLSIGTTFKGGIDRIEIIQSIVKEKGIEHVFYHADAALFGGFLPFYQNPKKPKLNFQTEPYDSIAISGHKFFGSPTPLGIFLIREEHSKNFDSTYIEYINSNNMTIPCSRSALNTLILWWTITTTKKEEFIRQTDQIFENALYFAHELQKRHYPVWLNEHSNTLFFEAPSMELCQRWTLPLQTCSKLGHIAHAIVMQHVDKKMIDEFLHDLDQEQWFTKHS